MYALGQISSLLSGPFSLDFFYKYSIQILAISLLISILFFFISFHLSQFKLNLKNDYSEFETQEQQYNLYFLFLGIIIPVMELINEIFHVRSQSLLLVNLLVGAFFIAIYVLATKNQTDNKIPEFTFSNLFFWLFFIYNSQHHFQAF